MSVGYRWVPEDIPRQDGRVAVVTGANSGIGYETAATLLERGATVVLACRDTDRAGKAVAELGSLDRAEIVTLDLASLESVRSAAARLVERFDRIDLLVNNAGVMWTPHQETVDGFELQFGTNHLGHFAFTGLLLDRMLTVPGSRVVTVASLAHMGGRIDFADLHSKRRYGRSRAYAQSKLANLLFAYELQRRCEAAQAATVSVAAHPGLTAGNLGRNVPRPARPINRVFAAVANQPTPEGALPQLRAATDPDVRGGEYFGPAGIGQIRGGAVRVSSSKASHDAEAARRLWDVSRELTGVEFNGLGADM